MDGVMEIILFTVCIVEPDVVSFRHGPLVGIHIFYLEIQSQMLNSIWVVKWLTVLQQLLLKFHKYTVYESILIIFEHQSTIFRSPVLFNLGAA